MAGTYVNLRTESDYSGGIPSDSGRVEAGAVSLTAKYWVTSRIEVGASVGWTNVYSQRVQAAALTLDSDWANVGYRRRISKNEEPDLYNRIYDLLYPPRGEVGRTIDQVVPPVLTSPPPQ